MRKLLLLGAVSACVLGTIDAQGPAKPTPPAAGNAGKEFDGVWAPASVMYGGEEMMPTAESRESIRLSVANGVYSLFHVVDSKEGTGRRLATAAFDADPKLVNLLTAPYFAGELGRAQHGWRRAIAAGATGGIPLPAMGSALAYYDGYRTARLPSNLLQAQRDYFGAHTYERTDKPRGEFFHTNWTGRGGNTTSNAYNA